MDTAGTARCWARLRAVPCRARYPTPPGRRRAHDSKVMAPGKSYAKTMVGTPYCLSPEVVEVRFMTGGGGAAPWPASTRLPTVQDKPYNSKTDCWSLGILLYELCALQRPFRGGSVSGVWGLCRMAQEPPKPSRNHMHSTQLLCCPAAPICTAIAVKILRGAYAPLPEQYSAEVHNLVAALLSRKPEQRPSVDEASCAAMSCSMHG